MTCARALDLMLKAEPAELRGVGPTPLAAHVRACSRCAGTARALLGHAAELEDALDRYALAGDPAAAADVALAASRAADTSEQGHGPAGEPAISRARFRVAPPHSGRWRWPAAAGAALAAAVAVWVLAPSRVPTRPPVAAPPPARAAASVAVVPPPDRLAAVIRTDNPKITIVWLMERGGS